MEVKHINYQTTGQVCSRAIHIDTEGDKIVRVIFEGGCHGNTQGLSRLLAGMNIDDVISRLDGVQCGSRGTSCPDQLAKALKNNLSR
ncbi:MAG: TIGR03905 family TSCPD domain-containing protein [Tannerellaceae bacterium]|nr:TIGR03905 family TSCPD domain-containing protein [Tannerellaceae bacterium]